MKFEFNYPCGFWENYVLTCWWDSSIWATLAEMSKVNLDLWNLFIAIVLLGLTYHMRIITLASTVLKNQLFKKKIPSKCIRKQILTLTLCRSRSTQNNHLNKLGTPTSSILHTKSQGHWPSGSRWEDVKGFTIYGRGSHLGHVTKIWLTYHKWSSHEIWVQLA